MSDELERAPSSPDLPDAVVERRRGLPLIWLIPLVAAVIGGWLAYTTWSEQGPTITITFDAGTGLEPGKTPIKYRDVQLGMVTTVDLSQDLSRVVVSAQMKKSASEHLRAGTQFWIESVRVTGSGVSGIGTLLSGAYIGMLPGPGKPARQFTGLQQPPVLQVNQPGRKFRLRAEKLGSLSAGSPVYFRGIPVGEVLGYALDADGEAVNIFAFVSAPYDALVRRETHFWNASGIDMSLGASGLSVRTESLVAILQGGIAFDTPVAASASEPSTADTVFPLYATFESIREAQFTKKTPYLLYFHGSVSGLDPGAAVVFHGIQIGVVESVRLEIDARTYAVRLPVIIEMEPQRATVTGATEKIGPQAYMARFVEKGLRAQLRPGNLLTGSQVVALDFFPDAKAAKLTYEGDYAVIPTVASESELLIEKATAVINNLAEAPVAQLVSDLRRAVQDLDKILGSTAVQQGIGPLLDTARAMLAQAETTLKAADGAIGPDSALQYDLAQLLKELTQTSRSLRTLADYLERHPNALIFGKEPSGDH